MIEAFQSILDIAKQKSYPDIHISVGNPPIIRNNTGDLESLTEGFEIFSQDSIEVLLREIIGEDNYFEFQKSNDFDWSYYNEKTKSRYRVNCYKDTNGYSIAMRTIAQEIPTLESLGFGDFMKSLCRKSKWLILVTGPTGTWKSTNLAWMVDYINTNFKKHIITIEDPIEFVFKNKQSLINQREVGIHTNDFASAMKSALREDPDVIMLGEMRDPETIKAAITLAETGHLVLSTLHTNDTVQSIDRIVDVFPANQQDQIRMQLAMSLIWIVAQRLVPRSDKDERIALREILINNDAVRNLIINRKTHQLYSVLEVSQKEWMVLMDNYLVALYKKGYISSETVTSLARDKENIRNLLS